MREETWKHILGECGGGEKKGNWWEEIMEIMQEGGGGKGWMRKMERMRRKGKRKERKERVKLKNKVWKREWKKI